MCRSFVVESIAGLLLIPPHLNNDFALPDGVSAHHELGLHRRPENQKFLLPATSIVVSGCSKVPVSLLVAFGKRRCRLQVSQCIVASSFFVDTRAEVSIITTPSSN